MTEEKGKSTHFSTGLWKKVSKTGNAYLGGSMQDYWVCFFNNGSTEKLDNDPDGFLKLFPKDKEDATKQPIVINIWKRTSKAGKVYMAGKRGKRFNIFVNEKKTKPNSPDYNLVIFEDTEPIKKREVGSNPQMPDNEVENPAYEANASEMDTTSTVEGLAEKLNSGVPVGDSEGYETDLFDNEEDDIPF